MQARSRLIGPAKKINRSSPKNSSKLPKEIWFVIFELLTIRELGRLAQVIKYLDAAVNEFELNQYCNAANLRNNRFKEPAQHDILTIEKLTNGWLFGDRRLRMLLKYANGNHSPVIIKFIDELTPIIFNSETNGFLKNPYLSNLLVCGALIQKGSNLEKMLIGRQWGDRELSTVIILKLLGPLPVQLLDFIEPSAVFLQEYLYRYALPTELHNRRNSVASMCNDLLRKISNDLEGYVGDRWRLPMFILHAVSDNNFCHCFYLQPEVTINFLVRIQKMDGAPYVQRQNQSVWAASTDVFRCVQNYPFLSPLVREWLVNEWLPDLDPGSVKFLINFIKMFGKKFSHTDQEALIKHLNKLNRPQREIYCADLLKMCDDQVKRKIVLNIPGNRIKALFEDRADEKRYLLPILDNRGYPIPNRDMLVKQPLKEGDIYPYLVTISSLTPQLITLFSQSILSIADIKKMQPDTIIPLDEMVTLCKEFILNQKLLSKLIDFSRQGCRVATYRQFFKEHDIAEPAIEQLKFMLAVNSKAFLQSGCARLIKTIGLATFNRWPVILEARSYIIRILTDLEKNDPLKCDELILLIKEAIREGSSLDLSFSLEKHLRCVGAKHKTMFFHDRFNAEKRRKRNPQEEEDPVTEPEHAFEYDYLQFSLQS